MKHIKVGIIDYGFGNISSLYVSLMTLGYNCQVSNKRSVLKKSDVLFLPGVGSFDAGMGALNQTNLSDFIFSSAKSGKGIIGICLGMQLLFSSSEEGKPIDGLKILPGKIKKVQTIPTHIGWNSIQVNKSRSIFNEFHNKHFYFNHTFAYTQKSQILNASSIISSEKEQVGGIVKKGNVYGLQFHPEKSQANGANLLKKIISKIYHA